MRDHVTGDTEEILQRAVSRGRTHLLEPEAFALCRSIGIQTPPYLFVPAESATAPVDLDRFPGDRLVIKVVAEHILHKSDVGGVVNVPNEPAAVRLALGELSRRFENDDVPGFGISAYVGHSSEPGTELLVSVAWNREFGGVITLALGGVFANALADNFEPDRKFTTIGASIEGEGVIRRKLESSLAGSLAAEPFRGRPAHTSYEALSEVVNGLRTLAAEAMPHAVAELEINPLITTTDGLIAVDATVRMADGDYREAPPRPIAKIGRLLQPGSIAVVGVSSRINPGRIILTNLLGAGFDPARVIVVKPGRDTIDGCRCVPDLASLPHPVDLCVLSIDAAQIPDAISEITTGRLAESVIVIPGGIGEVEGTEGRAHRVDEILRKSRETDWRGPVVNGGNCLGVRSVPGRYNTLFIPTHKLDFPAEDPAPLAVVAQSGALIAARGSKLQRINPRYVVSIGNQLDLTLGDYLNYFASEPEVQVIACYAEGFRPGDGAGFLRAARALTEAGRTVLLYRAGRTEAGMKATASHTAAIAGDYGITRQLAAQAGVIAVDDLADFEDLAIMAVNLRNKAIEGMRIGALSNAGYECVAVADNLNRFELAELSDDTRSKLEAVLSESSLSGIVAPANPFDVTPIMADGPFAECAEIILGDAGVDLGVVGCVPLTGAMNTLAAGPNHQENVDARGSVGHLIGAALQRCDRAAVAVIDAGPAYNALADTVAGYGVPTFRTMDRALRLFSAYCVSRAG